MAHEVENMMYATSGGTPWHGLGKEVEDTITAAEAIVAAGMDWDVHLKPLAVKEAATPNQACQLCTESGCYTGATLCVCECHGAVQEWLGEEVPNRAAVRSSDNKILGVVGPDFTPLQNREAFAWFDPFVQEGIATYHTAGSLKGGQVVWVLAKITGERLAVVGEDVIDRFILLSNAHNGTASCRAGFTSVRVVCANTLAEAHRLGDNNKLIRVRHTESIAQRMTEVRDIMRAGHSDFEATVEQYRWLAASGGVHEGDLAQYVRIVFFGPSAAEDESKGSRIFQDVMECYYKGRGNDMPGVKETMWGAYNAITEYLNYGRGRNQEAILHNVWFGDSVRLNQLALTTALEYARDMLGMGPIPGSDPA